MSLAQLLYPPPTPHGWKEWTFWNHNHHLAINSAILTQKGVAIAPFRLWPVDDKQISEWLEQHQLAHVAISQSLGIGLQDLTDLDFKDKPKRDAWFFIHSGHHISAAKALGVPLVG